MNMEELSGTIIKTGICRYGSKHYHVLICAESAFPGTGDYEDDVEIGNDREIHCYCIWFEDILTSGKLIAGGGYYETLNKAIHEAESSTGFIKWL